MPPLATMPIAAAITMASAAFLAAPAALHAQSREAAPDDQIMTVYGSAPADLNGLEEGPEIEGFIAARDADTMRIMRPDGAGATVLMSDGTQIRGKGGFLGLGRTALTSDSLMNGLPVKIETVRWANRLVASRIKFSNEDLETAAMIRTGTAQGFAEQTAATDALRGRMGDIDKYNIRGTTNVFFDTGKWNLTPGAEAELCTAANKAEGMDNALLLVVGYTDSVGSQDYNQVLSERRAGRVVNYLQQACGWKPWRMLTPTGMAEADPLADNFTEEGKAQNRRVSVNILVSKSVEGL